MISAHALREVVEKQWPGAEVIRDSVVRFTKRANGKDFAIFYLDVSDNLPDGPKALLDFQQTVIGSRYFEGSKSLQWNNYLYFVRDAAELANPKSLAEARDLLESDRTYARKRIISLDQVAAVLDPTVVEESQEEPSVGLLSTWLGILDEAGIRDAVVGDERMPARLKKNRTVDARAAS